MKTTLALALGLLASTPFIRAQEEAREAPAGESAVATAELPAGWTRALHWRSIGPTVQGGRLTDLAVVESDPMVFYIGSASGGLFKTRDGGITFEEQFQHRGSISIGDVCVAPSNPEIVWVGTGEANVRNSVSWGDGVHRSTDGGKTWEHMGLEHSRHIGRIAIHPENPQVVYVAAVGRLWGPNAERGLYKTSDGGETWDCILAVDERTGCNDVALMPGDPSVVLAAMYERQRDANDDNDPARRWGPGSGLYRSSDGGQSWTRLAEGLPSVPLGRMSFDFCRKKPEVVFAIIETERWAVSDEDADPGRREPRAWLGADLRRSRGRTLVSRVSDDGPGSAAGLKRRDEVLSLDGEKYKTSISLRKALNKHKVGDKVKLAVKRGDEELEIEIVLGEAPIGEYSRPHSIGLGGQRQNVQDEQGEHGFQSGGVFRSEDGGISWKRINSLNPRPYYYSQIRVDPADPSMVYVLGTSFYHSSDGGESFSTDRSRGLHLDHHAMWIDPRDGRHILLGNDGGLYESHVRGEAWHFVNVLPVGQFYHVGLGPRRAYRVYGGLQDNGSWGGPSTLRGRTGPSVEDWFQIGGGDGFLCLVDPEDPDLVYFESQGGAMQRRNLRTGESGSARPRREEGKRYRFNWKTPFLLSHHNPRIFYCAGNYVFRSLDRGGDGRMISPEITRTDWGSATALAESPRDPDILWVGTDDGKLWVTRDGGKEWSDVTAALPEVPGPRWVSSIEASRHSTSRAYVTLDGHRSDDDAAYVFVTQNGGKSWKSLRANLPAESTRVIREDLENRDLLYLGTEFGMWFSLDRGEKWIRMEGDLPSVAVHELAQHPSENELVAATHGRSLWILDVTPLRQLDSKVQKAASHVFAPATAVDWTPAFSRRLSGHRHFIGENRSRGAALWFMLGKPAEKVQLKILDAAGTELRTYDLKERAAGLHRHLWNLRCRSASAGDSGAAERGRGGRGGRGTRRPPMRKAEPGRYQVVLVVDGEASEPRGFDLVPDPEASATIGTGYVRQGPIR